MTPVLPSFVESLGHGLYAIDTGFHRARYDAAWLVVDSGRAAFIDTGTGFAVPRLLAALEAAGLQPAAVDYVIPTHVHLDHAGGVGPLMQRLPAATLLVHPRGARHLIDPSALYEGALAVSGQATMDADYGPLVGVPAERVRATAEGQTVHLGARALSFAHTPGHALHHHCIWDEASGGWFTGDTFGLSFPELRVDGRSFLLPTTTPVQFDPGALHASIDRLLARAPRAMYLTHFGPLEDVVESAGRLHALIDATVEAALAHRQAPDRLGALTQALLDLYGAAARVHGTRLAPAALEALLREDAALNAAGLEVWLDRTAPA